MLDEVDGDESQVDQLEYQRCALGERRLHTHDVGQKVKNMAPYNMSASSTNIVDLNVFSIKLNQ